MFQNACKCCLETHTPLNVGNVGNVSNVGNYWQNCAPKQTPLNLGFVGNVGNVTKSFQFMPQNTHTPECG